MAHSSIAQERQKYLAIAAEKPASLTPLHLLESASFSDAIFARVRDVAPESFAQARTLIAVSSIHNVLQRTNSSQTTTTGVQFSPVVAYHIPSVRQLAVSLVSEDPHIALAGALALAAVSKLVDVSGTRYASELALSLSLLDPRSLAEPMLGSAVNAITTLAAAGESCFARVGTELLESLRCR